MAALLTAAQIEAVEDELEIHDGIVKAAENWSKLYGKDAKTHAKLIRTEAKFQRVLRKFFREQADNSKSFVDWKEYKAAVKAYNVDVLVNDDALDTMNSTFIKVAFDPVATAVALGTQAAHTLYKIPLGLDSTSAVVQQIARSQVAALVGKIIAPDGSIMDNPRTAYTISDVTRRDIRESLHTSISMKETIDEAADRLRLTINDPRRAELIAQTETVNAYQGGLLKAGQDSGAVGKEWQDVGADDVCADNTAMGAVGIDDSFQDSDGGDIDSPVAHPRCRCGMRLIYQEEYDREGYTF